MLLCVAVCFNVLLCVGGRCRCRLFVVRSLRTVAACCCLVLLFVDSLFLVVGCVLLPFSIVV